MAINFNTIPYYDDFDQTKNFHRILFRPGYAVQARELTQLQTQIQDQINKFGDNIFVNGTVVTGAGRTFDGELTSMKMEPTYAGQIIDPAVFEGTIVSNTDGVQALVRLALPVTGSDPMTFIIKYISAGETSSEFNDGDVLMTADEAYSVQIATGAPFNSCMIFSIDSGVYYVDGKFVYLEPQTIAVDKYSNLSTKSVGLQVDESVVTSDNDDSLFDAAQGTPNFTAPGADRYAVTLTLKAVEVGEGGDTFIEVARISEGALVINNDRTIYSEIGKEMARRTFDESGDYTVRKWPIQILDHQDTPADPTKFTVALDPGKGYIKGYEYETISQTNLTLDRARDTAENLDADIDTTFGNYVVVKNLSGIFKTNATSGAYSAVEIHSVVKGSVTGATTKIGTAKVKNLWWLNGTPGVSTTTYRMYLFDIKMTGNFKNAESIVILTGGTTVVAGANIDDSSKVGNTAGGDAFVSGGDAQMMVFKAPNEFLETLKPNSVNNNSYWSQRTLTDTIDGAGQVALSVASNEVFEGTVGGDLSDDEKKASYHVIINSTGAVYDFTQAGTTIVLTDGGQTATFDFDDTGLSGQAVTILASVKANDTAARTKTLSTNYQYRIVDAGSTNQTIGGIDSLEVSDLYEVLTVYSTETDPTGVAGFAVNGTTGAITWDTITDFLDVTNNYLVDDGQRDELYDHGGIVLAGEPPKSTEYLVVVYKNFAHTGTGFLSVDSYGIDYADIPSFTSPSTGKSLKLSDCIDFRPRRADTATVMVPSVSPATSLTGGQVPDPADSFTTDYSYYLARFDKIVATADRQFAVQKGVPAVQPKVPVDISNGMTIYTLAIPPYTADISEIQIKYIDNRRYTMRDIGKLEKRINNLEYYTQLSLLEKQAKDTSIPDATNFEKFKNGFAVDSFTSQDIFVAERGAWASRRWGWWNSWFNGSNTWSSAAQNYNENSIADASSTSFNAAIDPINQELRAPFTVQFDGFIYLDDRVSPTNPGPDNTVKAGDLVTLDYSETVVISQTLASMWMNVNPFDVIKFIGTFYIEPSFDQWIETRLLPAVNKVVETKIPDAADLIVNNFTGSGTSSRLTSTTTTVQTNTVSSTTTSLGTSVVDVQIIPFIRSRSVVGVGKMFKPRARLYPFVDGTPVSEFCRPLTLLKVQHISGSLFTGEQGNYETLTFRTGSATGPIFGRASVAIYSDPTTANPTHRLLSIFDETVTGDPKPVPVPREKDQPVHPKPTHDKHSNSRFNSTEFRNGVTYTITDFGRERDENGINYISIGATADCVFTGYIQRRRLIVVSVVSGTLSRGMAIYRAGLTRLPVVIRRFGTGRGTTGTYRLNRRFATDVGSSGSPVTFNAIALGKKFVYNGGTTTSTTGSSSGTLDTTPTGTALTDVFVVGSKGGVAKIVTKTTYTINSPLVPDEFGNIGFEFQIPANRFKSGERTIRLIDNALNLATTQDSIGEAKYNAIGLLQSKQENILTTRTIQSQKVVTNNFQRFTPPRDPVAQSFFVDERQYPQGIHLSSVDVYFRSKSNTIPITMEVRRTVNGYPESSPTIPFGEVVKPAASVSISPLGTVATTFNFGNPVHLVPGEYAIVLLANTQDYEVFVSEMGGTVLGGTSRIDKQPYIGSFFASQNSSTWTADQNKDLKFVLRRAVFESTGEAYFDLLEPEEIRDYQTLNVKTSNIVPTGTNLVWYAKAYNNDGIYDTDWYQININQDMNFNQLKRLALIDNTVTTPTLKLKAVLTSTNDAVSPVIDASALSIVTAFNTINHSTYTARVANATFVEGEVTNGDNVIENVPVEVYNNVGIGMEVVGTSVADGVVITGNVIAMDKFAQTITVSNNATDTADDVGLVFTIDETQITDGGALARYITKPINLADGFDASNICVTVDINKPSGTSVKAFYRALPTESTDNIYSQAWVEMPLEKSIPNSLSDFDFREHRFFPPGAFDSQGIAVETQVIAQRFNSFQIKLVLLSTSQINTPRLRDLRIIALDQ